MIEKDTKIKELYDLHHRKDNLKHTGYDYTENVFKRTLSGVILDSPVLSVFLEKIRKPLVYMIESNLLIRNFWNYTVNKYYNKHNN